MAREFRGRRRPSTLGRWQLHPRAISRNPESEAAFKLKGVGVEVVQGDALDKESLPINASMRLMALREYEGVFNAADVDGCNAELMQCIQEMIPNDWRAIEDFWDEQSGS
ncbi:hypothetical protein C8R43DRAFT_943728 [Mycena crocata]|nr:hypothetical protein C8R43DRAFT_943728 [Mycena crocata]